MAGKSVYERFGTSALSGTDQTARTYKWKGGDTPWSVASFLYATGYDSEAWRQFLEANNVTDIDAIAVGQVFVVPTFTPTGN